MSYINQFDSHYLNDSTTMKPVEVTCHIFFGYSVELSDLALLDIVTIEPFIVMNFILNVHNKRLS